jgi:two-component system, OmpR family, sensor histidine kinase KdpD
MSTSSDHARKPSPVPMHGAARPGLRARRPPGWRAYAGTGLIVAGCSATAALMQPHFDLSNLTMVYLVGVVLSAIAFGRGPAIAAAVLSVAVFDFVFVPPRFTFEVADTQYLVTFAVMLLVAVVIGTLTAWLREQLEIARLRELRTEALYRLSNDLAVRSTAQELLQAAVARIAEVHGAPVAILLPGSSGRLEVAAGEADILGTGREREAAQWAYANGESAGSGTPVFPETHAVHLALKAPTKSLGVLSVRSSDPRVRRDPERVHLLRALASQTALALERCRLADEAQAATMEAEAERTRNALLSSVSHDLRTPLAAITGAASSLHDVAALSAETRRELADTISEEAQRLNRLIGNLLEMTRLESGTVHVRKDWHSLEEVVGAALGRLEPILGDRVVQVALPADLPLIPLDDVLFEQVLWNLIENAHKYSPEGRPIDVSAAIDGRELRLEVSDRGPGVRLGDEPHVFEKFYRGQNGAGKPGFGLGLAICRGIVAAHGGTIQAASRPGGGARFIVRLSLEGEPPTVEAEAPAEAPTGDA